jgi:hypothetical protein
VTMHEYIEPEDFDEEVQEGRCWACGGTDEDGYEGCEFAGDPVYVPGPGGPETFGCPRLTGTF